MAVDHAHAELRRKLGLPHNEKTQAEALTRAEEEARETALAAEVWVGAAIVSPTALVCAELLFWVGQAHAARSRLHHEKNK